MIVERRTPSIEEISYECDNASCTKVVSFTTSHYLSNSEVSKEVVKKTDFKEYEGSVYCPECYRKVSEVEVPKTVEIGNVINYEGTDYIVFEGCCQDCAFTIEEGRCVANYRNLRTGKFIKLGSCLAKDRSDRKNVSFLEANAKYKVLYTERKEMTGVELFEFEKKNNVGNFTKIKEV